MGTWENIRLFIRLTRPLFLLGVAILYALGVGIAHYLGVTIDWRAYWLCQAWVTLLQLSTQYFNEYYDFPNDQENQNRTVLTGGSGALGEGKLPRRIALMAALTCLAFLASLTVVLISRVDPPIQAYLIMGFAFLCAFFYSNPPISLEASGYGELVASVVVAFMVPTYAFIVQAGEMHRLVSMTVFPLTALLMAALLVFDLPDLTSDMKHEKRTLLARIGWQNGVLLHNILVLSAYLLLGLAAAFGYPWFAMLAGMLSLPIGLFQMWQIRNIVNGAKPNWNALTIGALAMFASTAYLLAYAFWTH